MASKCSILILFVNTLLERWYLVRHMRFFDELCSTRIAPKPPTPRGPGQIYFVWFSQLLIVPGGGPNKQSPTQNISVCNCVVMLPVLLFSLFAFQWHLAVPLPLEWEDPTAVPATTTTTTPTRQHGPWSFLPPCFGRRKDQPALYQKSLTHDDDGHVFDQASNLLNLDRSSPKDHNSPRGKESKRMRRQLLRRANEVLGSNALTTGLFVALIVVSVLIGVGVASIAVCGFDWKCHRSRSSIADDVEVAQKDIEVVEARPRKTG
ncbi:uncharacterized protein B0T15DRAFT_516616 [Chaetomium strumarium]|uniref:Uncharacterized protein n=1 Tax=Chaetomium strumarium TaxID=1170767 RepID=A0AAJ0M5R3_9PEZI|nr:hypothetical protein B0T15DRAFT_516616 [Chaetomium strumarium]